MLSLWHIHGHSQPAFRATLPHSCREVTPLQGKLGGSGRKIIRLSAGPSSAIGILYDVREENVAFLEFSRHFRRHGLPVPEIYGEDLSQERLPRRRPGQHNPVRVSFQTS
jgi:hypothetical protein